MNEPVAIGIDLGTTYSVISYINEYGLPEIVTNTEGDALTPSVICFEESNTIVGEEAKAHQALGEENVVAFFKRNMGNANYAFITNDAEFNAKNLSAILLKKLRADIQQFLRHNNFKTVITVPAYFNNFQRNETIEAAQQAGLDVIKIINEPTAAALAFGINKNNSKTAQKILVYDLGGGTFDVTVIELNEDTVKVLGTGGDHELGGKDWDDRILLLVADLFKDEFDESPLDEIESFNDLMIKAEQLKKQLTDRKTAKINIVYNGNKGKYEISKDDFENASEDLLERTNQLCEKVLTDIGLSWNDLDGVLAVGGSTKMPMINNWISNISGKAPITGINVDEAVAKGAAIQAYLELQKNRGSLSFKNNNNNKPLLGGISIIQDVMSHSLGMIAENEDRSRYINTILIPKNKTIPVAETQSYQLKTSASNNNEMEVYMTQGENEYPTLNKILGKYVFNNIEHQPNGKTLIEVSYKYNANGMVEVEASQKENGKNLPLTIEPVPDDLSWLDTAPKDHTTTIEGQLNIVIAIDLSGSMRMDGGKPLIESIKAAHKLVDKLNLTNTKVGVVGFADDTQVVCQPNNQIKEISASINRLSFILRNQGTHANPFEDCFNSLIHLEGKKFIIVLTDGAWFKKRPALRSAQKCKEQDMEIVAIGFGDADERFLKEIATSDENALFTNLDQIVTSFSKIGQVLSNETAGLAVAESGKKGGIFKLFN